MVSKFRWSVKWYQIFFRIFTSNLFIPQRVYQAYNNFVTIFFSGAFSNDFSLSKQEFTTCSNTWLLNRILLNYTFIIFQKEYASRILYEISDMVCAESSFNFHISLSALDNLYPLQSVFINCQTSIYLCDDCKCNKSVVQRRELITYVQRLRLTRRFLTNNMMLR